MNPGLARELVGRMEILTLWPLSQGEIGRKRERFTELVFSEAASEWSRDTAGTLDIWERSLRGGYPEALTRDSGDRRNAWYRSYISTVVQREVRDMANIEGLSQLPRLLALLAARVGGLLNVAEISNAIDIPQTTLKRYLALLEATHLVKLVPAWSGNVGKRLMKSPKLYLVDTGLLAHLLGMDIERLRTDHPVRGAFLENFVVIEVLKQFGWGSERVEVFHFRTSAGLEVDFILEDSRGNCVCLEVKSSHTVRSEDFRGMKTFASLVGSRFQAGVVLYAGSEVVPFGEGFHAVPLAALWEASA